MKHSTSKIIPSRDRPFRAIFLLYTIYMIYFSFIHGSDYGTFSGILCFMGAIGAAGAGRFIGETTIKNTFRIEYYLVGIFLAMVGYVWLFMSEARLGLLDNLDPQLQTIVWAIINTISGIFVGREDVRRNDY